MFMYISPWYVAAASGPKDVILVLDVSGSMSFLNRLNIMKEAAKTVIETLSFVDFVGIVKFASSASYLGNSNALSHFSNF